MAVKNIRLFIFDKNIEKEQNIILDKEQSHYISKVMRAEAGEEFRIFNDSGSEWLVRVVDNNKNATIINPIKEIRNLQDNNNRPKLKVYFAPIKNQKLLNLMIEKMIEVGVNEIQPIITDFTNNHRLNIEKSQDHIIEATEQSERLDIATINEPIKLKDAINNISKDEALFICCEKAEPSNHLLRVMMDVRNISINHDEENDDNHTICYSILIGPEGGFSANELSYIDSITNHSDDNNDNDNDHKKMIHKVSLGKNIMRAETAAICAAYLLKSYMDVNLVR